MTTFLNFQFSKVQVKSESLVAQSRSTLCDPWTTAVRLLWPWEFPGKNTGMSGHVLLIST